MRWLSVHPNVEIAAAVSKTCAGKSIAASFPGLARFGSLKFTETADPETVAACQVVFFAQDNGVAMKVAPGIAEQGVKVIDLAADFRLKDTAVFEQWYGMAHTCPDLLAEAVYGLPELNLVKGRWWLLAPPCGVIALALLSLNFAADRLHSMQSITKTFAHLAFDKLVAAGRVDPTRSVGDYVPEAGDAYARASVQQVLDLANGVLGGSTALPSTLTISDLNAIVDSINKNYDNGTTNSGYCG